MTKQVKIRRTKADDVFSEYIRRRAILRAGGCERGALLGLPCGRKYDKTKDDGSVFPAWKQLDAAHYEGRSSKSLRFHEDNGAGVCHGCHSYIDAHPAAKDELFRAILGDKAFEKLKLQVQVTARYPIKIDENQVYLYFKAKINQLEIRNPVGFVDE